MEWGKAKGVSKAPKAGKVRYAKLDALGRTRTARATITYKMVAKAAERGRLDIPYSLKPSGWGHNALVSFVFADGSTGTRYFWNRSHLIADSLGGAVKRRNLICGTRMQNVGAYDDTGGMAFCECLARTWLYRNHTGSVYYSARPVYKGNELVPRSVVVNMKSSDGTLNRRFVVYNAARGYRIDYADGSFSAKAKTPGKLVWPAPSAKTKVFLAPNGTKYHRTKLCEGLAYAASVNKTTCAAAKADGKDACSLCW